MSLTPLPDDVATEWITRYAERWGLELFDPEPDFGEDAVTIPWPHRLSSASAQSEVMHFHFEQGPWVPPEQRRSFTPGPARRFNKVLDDFAIRTGTTSLVHLAGAEVYIVRPFEFGEETEQSVHFPASLEWA